MADASPSKNELELEVERLRREVQRLRDFSELSSDWFWEQDENLRFVGFSGISTEKLRRRQRDFIGRLRWEMPISGVSEEDMAAHIACCKNHQPFRDFEYDISSDEGESQRYSISGTPIFDQQGRFRGYHGVGRNITPLHRAQLAVKDSERKLSQILMGSPVPIFVLDADHRVTHWNRACEKLTGIAALELLGSSKAWRGFYQDNRPTLADLVVDRADETEIGCFYGNKFRQSNLVPGAYEAEDFFPSMGEGGRWLYFTASPLLNDSGERVGAIETLQDISQRKQAEHAERQSVEQLRQAHIELQSTMSQLVEAKKLAGLGRLVAGVAHELNTPVGNALLAGSSMQGMVDGMQEAFDNNTLSKQLFADFLSEGTKALTLMQQNIQRSSFLVKRFRELAEDQRHTAVVKFHPCDTAETVSQLRAKQLKEKTVDFEIAIDNSIEIEGYQDALQQVIDSLLENSLVHGLEKGGKVSLSAIVDLHDIEFCFRDNGCGMSDEQLLQAFDPFYSTRFGQGSSGLGLYRVYNLVTVVFGGRIQIDSEPGEGVIVTFRLPTEQS